MKNAGGGGGGGKKRIAFQHTSAISCDNQIKPPQTFILATLFNLPAWNRPQKL